MGNNMIPTATAVWGKTYFSSDPSKFIENERIEEEGTLLSSIKDSVDPYNYHVLKCDEGVFKTMECNQIHILWPNDEYGENNKDEDVWIAQQQLDDWVEE